MKKNTFLQEEKNSTKLFLWLFFVVFFVYDILYYDLFPKFAWLDFETGSSGWYDFMFIKYGIIVGLIPISIYLIKKKQSQ